MANDTELERKQLQVFCGSAGEQQTSVFGTMKNPAPDYSKDPETLQGTNWPQGWQNAIAADDAPFMEDMNSLFYVLSYMVKYLYQHGIPEWNNKETYTASKSVVLRNGKFYLAKQTTGADNPQDPATDASFTYWYLALDPVNPLADQNWVKGYAQSLVNLSQAIDSSTSKYPSNKAVQTAIANIDLSTKANTDLSNVSTTGKKTATNWGMPNYSAKTSLSNNFTADRDYIGYARARDSEYNGASVKVNGVEVFFSIMTNLYRCRSGSQFFIPKGATVTTGGDFDELSKYPLIGG